MTREQRLANALIKMSPFDRLDCCVECGREQGREKHFDNCSLAAAIVEATKVVADGLHREMRKTVLNTDSETLVAALDEAGIDHQELVNAGRAAVATAAKKTCNLHDDCDSAPRGSDHCRDECCEDCFGN